MYNDMLNKTCTIYRSNSAEGYDFSLSEEGEVLEEFTVVTSAPCRLDPAPTPRNRYTGGLIESGAQMLFVKPNTNIREHDRVGIEGRKFRVSAIREVYGMRNLHHLEVTLTLIDRDIQ